MENNKMKNKLEVKIENIGSEIEYTRLTLISNARRLADAMNRIAEEIERNPDSRPNSIGVVQTSGPQIDLLCMQLNQQQEQLKSLLDLKKALGE